MQRGLSATADLLVKLITFSQIPGPRVTDDIEKVTHWVKGQDHVNVFPRRLTDRRLAVDFCLDEL